MGKLDDSNVPERTIWLIEIGRGFPVVHEHRQDGTSIVHIRPSGGKSNLMNEMSDQLRERSRVD